MPSLLFHRDGRAVMRHLLNEDFLTIGRDPNCTIQLTEDDISRVHCEIKWKNGSYVITDRSTNGTFVCGDRVKSHNLKSGDIINIGGWKIEFHENDLAAQHKTIVREASPTNILKYETSKKELTTELMEFSVNTSNGSSQKYNLSSASIGSSPTNDIVISDDPYISSNHCTITFIKGNYILEDKKSKNGTFLNDKKVSKAFLPQTGEIIIGRTTIKFRTKQFTERLKANAVTSIGPIIGKSQAMQEIFALLERICGSEATICIMGESGTGKELIARFIHESGPRRTKPFVALNCGAIPENLIESELFGHERGAFTNATNQHRGVFEQANSGSLFLDEIGEMPLDLQTRLLRVLETKQIRHVGGQADIPADVRIIVATNKNLKNLVTSGNFREDLFFRLYVVPIILPSLRERKEDINLLVEHILEGLAPNGKPKQINSSAMDKLMTYNWPGNVRELKNTIQRAVLVSKSSVISSDDITFSDISKDGLVNNSTLDEHNREMVINTLKHTKGNTSESARRLGVSRTTLASMIKRFEIDLDKMRDG